MPQSDYVCPGSLNQVRRFAYGHSHLVHALNTVGHPKVFLQEEDKLGARSLDKAGQADGDSQLQPFIKKLKGINISQIVVQAVVVIFQFLHQ
jgi:hypothetical protein